MSESTAPELLAFDLADRLHKALRLSGCKPGEMASVLGVSASTMTNYLNGKTRPKDGMLRQWAMRCGTPVTFDWLAYGIEPGGGGARVQEESPTRWSVSSVVDIKSRRSRPLSAAA